MMVVAPSNESAKHAHKDMGKHRKTHPDAHIAFA